MLRMRYVGEENTEYDVDYFRIDEHHEALTGDFPIKNLGYELCRYDKEDWWDHSTFNTIYQNIDGGATFSNDESVYVKPLPIVTFVAYGATLEGDTVQHVSDYSELSVPAVVCDMNYQFFGWDKEIFSEGLIEGDITYTADVRYIEPIELVKARKIEEMNKAQQDTINDGVQVVLSDDTTERFTLTANDQLSLQSLKSRAENGETKLSWHDAQHENSSKYYSAEDILKICDTKDDFISFHVAYFRDLRIYINSLTTKDEVEAVEYGIEIPEQYQSEVVKDYYTDFGAAIASYYE